MGFRKNADDDGQPRKRRRKPLFLALVAGAAGWVYVKVIRAGRPDVTEEADDAEAVETNNRKAAANRKAAVS
ncbi:MAG TPA: hypothetical protein VK611_15115 [Acidimicrobiales bacterium]|nr:hypothetical protein [Acidimicrobiales bacterium]